MERFARNSDTAELRELSAATKRFAEQTFTAPPSGKPEFSRSHFEALGKLGLTGMNLPENLGGTPCSALTIASSLFEISRLDLGPAIYLSVHLMVSRLIAANKQSTGLDGLLCDAAAAKKLGAFCLTEAQAGSDAASLQCRAEKTSGGYRLTGEKIYITSAPSADFFLVFARTGKSGAGGISAFVVERGAAGLSFGSPEKKMGCEGAPIGSVSFESCEVPAKQLLGKEGDGYKIALGGLAGGRVNIAAAACGVSFRALELSLKHLQERRQFGQALAEFQGLQFMVADMAVALEASILLTRSAAEELDRGGSAKFESAAAKCFASDAAMKITTDAVQLFGGAGYLAEYGVERLMRDAKMLQIVEGTNQIQRLIIARELFGA